MRPGKRRENIPYQDLPLGDDDSIDIPWPYFQEIDWHHKYGAPHPPPTPMEDYIDILGRWATVEDEAELRRDARKGLRDREAQEEKDKLTHQIMDDTDDDEEEELASAAGIDFLTEIDSSSTDDAIASDDVKKETLNDENDEDDSEDFLLQLGLDIGTEEEENYSQQSQIEDDQSNLVLEKEPQTDFDEKEQLDVDDILSDLSLGDEEMNENDLQNVSDDDENNSSPPEVVPLDSLNDEDELDDKNEVSIDYDDYDYNNVGYDFDDFNDDSSEEENTSEDSEDSW
jgi:hypothetical protein